MSIVFGHFVINNFARPLRDGLGVKLPIRYVICAPAQVIEEFGRVLLRFSLVPGFHLQRPKAPQVLESSARTGRKQGLVSLVTSAISKTATNPAKVTLRHAEVRPKAPRPRESIARNGRKQAPVGLATGVIIKTATGKMNCMAVVGRQFKFL